MIIDTSVWIDFFAASETNADRWLTDRIAAASPVILPEVVLMELMIGTTDESKAAARRKRLQHFVITPLAPVQDVEEAAAIHRVCRRGGSTVRSLIDCLVAAMALRLDVEVAHRDRDFDVIATHCGLRTVPLF